MNKLNSNKIIMGGVFLSLFIPNVYALDEAGKTIIARGDVRATSSTQGDHRKLKRRTPVFTDDTLTTGASSKAQFRMTDGGVVALKENTVLTITDYQFNGEEGGNSVVLDLVQGGMRSITGEVKAERGDYKLKTPMGSMAIRGTHYEVELLDEKLWIAVWHGAVDVTVDVGLNSGSVISLGAGEDYSYATIDVNGVFMSMLEPPKIFAQGRSSSVEEKLDSSVNNESFPTPVEEQSQASSDTDAQLVIKALEENSTEFVTDDPIDVVESQSIADLVTAKQGLIEYSDAEVSSDYNLSNFSAGMVINFDSGLISDGKLSFNDDRSTDQWNAVFSGNMYIRNDDVFLETDITFASHGNNLADGNISAGFVELLGLDAVTGGFELFDLASDVRVDGSYIIK
jgi:hypothetical protein